MAVKMAATMVKNVKFDRNSVFNHKQVINIGLKLLFEPFRTTLYAVCTFESVFYHLRICSIEVFNPL